MYKKVVVCVLFVVVICVPSVVSVLSRFTGKEFDIELNGYTTTYNKPKFLLKSYKTKEFQNDYEKYRSAKIGLRSYAIKLYGQIRYWVFNNIDVGMQTLGKNKNIIGAAVINSEFINDFDFSNEDNKVRLQKYVVHLQSVQRKLENKGKFFLFVITPSKAFYCFDDVPLKYHLKRKDGFVSGHDYLIELLKHTDVNYIDSRNYVSVDTPLPPFYITGFHWSRPFAQRISQEILKNCAKVSKKNIANLCLLDLKSSEKPYWRDADIINLINVYSKPKVTYYQYDERLENDALGEKLSMLFQGGSFKQDFTLLLAPKYSNSEIYEIFYCERTWDNITKEWRPFKSWDELDFQKYLDTVDFVVVELNEASITSYSNGFVDYLDNFLDTYIPSSGER